MTMKQWQRMGAALVVAGASAVIAGCVQDVAWLAGWIGGCLAIGLVGDVWRKKP